MDRNPAKLICAGIIALGVVYGIQLLIFYSFYTMYNIELKWLQYLLPLFVEIGLILLVLITYLIHYILYAICYTFSLAVLGIELHMIPFVAIYLIINAFVSVNKIIGIIIVIVLPAIICIYGFINAFIINIDRITLTAKGFGKTVTIAHLSDLHLGVQLQKGFCHDIVSKLMELNPDVIVITGDLSDGSMKVKSEWMEPFDILSKPILYITGNHEQIHGKSDLLREVALTNIQHIGNECKEICGINFIGVDYEYNLLNRLDEFYDKGYLRNNPMVPNVLLSHVPSLKPEQLNKYNIFLFLAGHTHGGQLFPFHILSYCFNACFCGLYQSEDNYVYVSSGVGFANIPMRTFSKSVIGLITIKGDN